MPTTRRLSRTSNADMVAVACCKCIEDGVTTFITQIELLDRINLLINGAIGVRRATSHTDEKNSTVAKNRSATFPTPPSDGGKIANVGQSWCSYSVKCCSWIPLMDIRSSVGNGVQTEPGIWAYLVALCGWRKNRHCCAVTTSWCPHALRDGENAR